MKCLVTGSAGFFGRVLARDLAARGHEVVGLDLHGGPEHAGPEHRRIRGDVRDEALLDRLCREHRFDAVFHCAALLAHDAGDRDTLWQTNVDGTRVVAEAARRHGTRPFVFVSSNCVYSRSHDEPVGEDVPPEPAEIYGRSKLAAERLLRERAGDGLVPVVLRTPTIIDEGRLGLLAILFEFIDEGRRVWVVGRGDNRYQFVAAADLADACVRAAGRPRPDLYHVGADDVRPLRAVYEHVIREAGTGARVASLPKRPTLLAMRLAHKLRLSPLGPYHYRMIASSFVFDTTRAKRELGWRPTLANEQVLARAYRYYRAHRAEIEARRDVSAHRRGARMGVIRLLKWLS